MERSARSASPALNGNGRRRVQRPYPAPEAVLELIPEPALLLDTSGRLIEANRLATDLFGSRDFIEANGPGVLADAEAVDAWLEDEDGPDSLSLRTEGRRENQIPFTVDVSAGRLETGGRELGLFVLHELCDQRLMSEAQLYFDVAFENAPIGMALFNTNGEYMRVNDALCAMLDRPREELVGRRDQEFTHPDDREADIEPAWRILRGELDTWQCEKRFVRRDGSVVWTIANLTFLRTPDGHPLSWVGQFQDITERKGLETHLQDLADRDPLTGVFNRRLLEREAVMRIETGRLGSLMILDLDGFKAINDNHGHRTGDRVLIGIATALQESLRDDDLVARIGGDEFALLLEGTTENDARNVAALALEVVRSRRFRFDPGATVSASIGIACFGPHRRHSFESLMAEADQAMYKVKAHAKIAPLGARRVERRRPQAS